ncbi:MAG TPA: hypothetical protein DDW52_24690 [Planctomycetaceae bacterium]|nr:hypothetical protein [Planctomycetaceae bacterium]
MGQSKDKNRGKKRPGAPAGAKSEQPNETPAEKSESSLKHDLFVGAVGALLAAFCSWLLLWQQIGETRQDASLSMKQSVVKDLSPMLFELKFLHTFRVWSEVETYSHWAGRSEEEHLAAYLGLDAQNELREKYPTEHAKALEYHTCESKVMGLLLLVQLHFGSEQGDAARKLIDRLDHKDLQARIRQNWNPEASPRAFTYRLQIDYDKALQSDTEELLSLLLEEIGDENVSVSIESNG